MAERDELATRAVDRHIGDADDTLAEDQDLTILIERWVKGALRPTRYRLDRGAHREKWSLLWLLVPQRVGYRQVMYYVVLKAITQAMRGPMVGWGKLQRTGRVTTA